MGAEQSARALIRQYGLIPPGSTVLCAVSGGADSVCLLHLLHRLQGEIPFTLAAAHYNHRLRGAESDRDEDFVRDFTARFLDPRPPRLVVGSGDVAQEAKRRGTGLEETARDMRYAFLRETAQALGAHVIALAHNADDHAETMLLHLLRGCALRGLTGILPRRDDLVRPLLTTPRREIEAYLHAYGLPHVEDSTNADDSYARNRVRHQILPLLQEIDPGFLPRMWSTAQLLQTDEAYLSAQAQAACSRARWADGELALPAADLAGLPDALAPRAVRFLIGQLRSGNDDCTAAHLNAVVALARGSDPSASVRLPGGLLAQRSYQDLLFTFRSAPPPLQPVIPDLNGVTAAGDTPWLLRCRRTFCPENPPLGPDAFWVSLGRLSGPLTLRSRQTGDRLSPPGRGGKTLKKWLIETRVPRRERERIPVLADQLVVVAVAGLGPDRSRLARPGEDALELQFICKKRE